LICSSCNTVYSPAPDQLGQVESLAGFCEKCGTEPRLKRFAVAFTEGAIAGVLSVEILLFFLILGGAYLFLIPPVVVAVICLVVYTFASRSEPVRYHDKKHRQKQTLGHRVAGWATGFVVGLTTLLGFMELL